MIRFDGVGKSFAITGGRYTLSKRKHSGRIEVLRSIDLQADDGSITGLLGANGAGKTTSLRILAGLIGADRGSVSVDGIDVALEPRRALARLGVLSDARGLYPRLTARENIVYYGRLHGMGAERAEDRAEQLGAMLDFTRLLDRRTEGFSQGERMKTALARALIHDPPNIVLDEPTNGLDVLATRALRESLRWLRTPEGGSKCIVFSTHVMQEVERVCDRVVVIAEGRTVATGTVAELLALSGCSAFEEAFVALAYPDGGAHGQSAAEARG
jgi:sodium transport system ATP-binding protein